MVDTACRGSQPRLYVEDSGRKGGVFDTAVSATGLVSDAELVYVPAEFKTRMLSFGIRRLLGNRTAVPVRSGSLDQDDWRAPGWASPQGGGREEYDDTYLRAGGLESFGCPTVSLVLQACLEATQWKVLVTFLPYGPAIVVRQAFGSGGAQAVRRHGPPFLESAARWGRGVRGECG